MFLFYLVIGALLYKSLIDDDDESLNSKHWTIIS